MHPGFPYCTAVKLQYLVNWAPPYHAMEHMSWESAEDCSNARGAIKKYEDRQKALAEFDPSQKLDFDNLMAPVHMIGDRAKCVGCSGPYTVEACRKGAGTVTFFCGACIGGIAHERWCQMEDARLGQIRHVRNLMMGMACATNYGVTSTW